MTRLFACLFLKAAILVSFTLTQALAEPAAVHQDDAAITVAKRLNSAEIATLVSGNTLSGTAKDGTHYLEYLDPRGLLLGARKGKSDEGGYSGWWEIKGEELCIMYREFLRHDGCWFVELRDAEVLLIDHRGITVNEGRPIKILPGNGLDL
jgi:hypothetical protein